MKAKLKLLIALFMVGASPASAQPGAETEARPFHISSRQTGFGVQGEFEGTYRIHNASIELDVRKATIYVSEHCPYQGRSSINSLKFGLWNEAYPKGQTAIESSSQPFSLNFIMSPKEEYSLYDLHFSIPKESTTDLSKRWIVVVIQTDAIDSPNSNPGSGFTLALSCKDIFKEQTDEK
jgi:hypothetical protein